MRKQDTELVSLEELNIDEIKQEILSSMEEEPTEGTGSEGSDIPEGHEACVLRHGNKDDKEMESGAGLGGMPGDGRKSTRPVEGGLKKTPKVPKGTRSVRNSQTWEEMDRNCYLTYMAHLKEYGDRIYSKPKGIWGGILFWFIMLWAEVSDYLYAGKSQVFLGLVSYQKYRMSEMLEQHMIEYQKKQLRQQEGLMKIMTIALILGMVQLCGAEELWEKVARNSKRFEWLMGFIVAVVIARYLNKWVIIAGLMCYNARTATATFTEEMASAVLGAAPAGWASQAMEWAKSITGLTEIINNPITAAGLILVYQGVEKWMASRTKKEARADKGKPERMTMDWPEWEVLQQTVKLGEEKLNETKQAADFYKNKLETWDSEGRRAFHEAFGGKEVGDAFREWTTKVKTMEEENKRYVEKITRLEEAANAGGTAEQAALLAEAEAETAGYRERLKKLEDELKNAGNTEEQGRMDAHADHSQRDQDMRGKKQNG